MKTIVHLVRHGEVENPSGIIYVRLPGFRLSKVGYFQAEKARRFFEDQKISAVYASPLRRAKQTAEIVANGDLKLKYSKKFQEVGFLKWQGIQPDARNKKDLKTYMTKPTKSKLGESIVDCQNRMVKGIEEVIRKHFGQEIIIVSHAAPILAALVYYQGISLDEINHYMVANCEITSLIFNTALQCEQIETRKVVPARKDLP